MCTGGKKAPDLPPAPTPPPVMDEAGAADAVKKAQGKASSKVANAASMGNTILTGPLGVTGEADLKKKTLLGS
jgi:hypothetical protein